MKNNLFILLVFWWSFVFPTLSFNSFTTDIIDNNLNYYNLYDKKSYEETLKNADYDFWLKTILFSD